MAVFETVRQKQKLLWVVAITWVEPTNPGDPVYCTYTYTMQYPNMQVIAKHALYILLLVYGLKFLISSVLHHL